MATDLVYHDHDHDRVHSRLDIGSAPAKGPSDRVLPVKGTGWRSKFARASKRLRGKLLGRRLSYSQLGEDAWIMINYWNSFIPDGVVVEVGVGDGRTYSNSLALEDLTSRPAVLIEPVPAYARQIASLRPSASVWRVAIAGGYGIQEFRGESEVAGLEANLPPEYIDNWGLGGQSTYLVPTMPLSSIIACESLQHIDLLSIDVQGGELEVLEGMGSETEVGCIVIELDGMKTDKDASCRELLLQRGFVHATTLHISEIWVNPTYSRHHLLYSESNAISAGDFEYLFRQKSTAW